MEKYNTVISHNIDKVNKDSQIIKSSIDESKKFILGELNTVKEGKLEEINKKLDSNKCSVLEHIDKGNIAINSSIKKVQEVSQILKSSIDTSTDEIRDEINILKDSNLNLEEKLNNLDGKLDYIIKSIQNLSIQLDKNIINLNKDMSKKLNKESREKEESLKEIHSELSNLNELTKITIVNNMSSILEEV